MLHNTLNTLTLLHSGKPLKYKAVFTGRSIRFEYPDGTSALVGGIKTTNTAEWPIRGEFDNKLTYQSVNGKSYNDTTRLSKEALKAKMENGTLGNNYTNSAGGKVTLMNLDETVDFPLQYRYLVNFLKKAENEKYQNDMLHKVAGKWHIGYGHQLTEAEAKSPEWQQYKNKSFSEPEAAKLLMKDILDAEVIAEDNFNNFMKKDYKGNTNVKFKDLDSSQKMMLVEMSFNMGNRMKKFKKFMTALVNKDYNEMELEYHRTFEDEDGNRKPLEERNKQFFGAFIGPNIGKFSIKDLPLS